MSASWQDEAIGCSEWTGTPLRPLLKEAGLLDAAVEILFTGHDRGIDQGVEHDYERSLSLEDALREEVILAYGMNGRPLPPRHVSPLRLVVPEWYGMASVKWLKEIKAVSEPFEGVQQALLYYYRQSEEDPGTPVIRKRPHALMAPPRIPTSSPAGGTYRWDVCSWRAAPDRDGVPWSGSSLAWMAGIRGPTLLLVSR